MIVGTAGHIDHGKTSLIKRLTGKNTDRLPEEIKRGISIELGYAYVPLGSGADDVLGFVDVPGHERFVHTMLAGATGIDLALLVVAADDGVMPQTEEHFDILQLLGVTDGAIALTKIDAVEPARVDEVRAQLQRWLAGAAAAAWPVFPLSSVSGAGVEALDAHLRAQAAAHHARAASGSFRLAIDRVFTLAGIGTVVTGTAHAGRVRVGDEVMVQPGALRTRVRSLRVQDRPAGAGCAGQRCALNLAGVAKEDVRRGTWVQAPELANVSERLDATLRLSLHAPKALSGWTTVHFHHGTEDVMARLAALDADIPGGGSTRGAAAPARSSPAIAPGGEPLITLQLAAPIAVCKGDRFVIRDASASRTLGGGVVLDIAPPARGKRRPDRLQFLRALRELPPTPAFERWLAREPVLLTRLANGWNLRADEIPPLLAAARAQVAGGTAFTASYWDTLRAKALAAVAATHEREPEMPGLEQNRLRRIVAPQLAADVIAELVEGLLHDGQLARRGAFVALPTHKAELAANERVLWERLKPRLLEHPYQPPRVRDIAREMGLVETEVRAVLKRVARVGEVTLVAHDHYFLSDAVRAMADIAAELAQTQGAARAAPFRDRIGGGRKVAIQILEFFDRVGYTRRVRDDHVLRRDNPWRQTTPSSPSAREREKTS